MIDRLNSSSAPKCALKKMPLRDLTDQNKTLDIISKYVNNSHGYSRTKRGNKTYIKS